ncbi:MAG: response regulator [Pseudanabaena sp. M135S2SP2A07QC]|nr:response regulator [Pseudanabaena sp. M090S1SP2A07QC]MCA6504898.1 response regulator [Pseudanabaena sp. M172S2SP2A07QC]MCA6522137.1 response regulator [Pseudanabaena sp. M051S1SP2A07QC]MCA6524731.1 response regulator [Pseudanabaena sp. M179S2SP2A07QC]MCA6528906.1 response regulator [Pseudanabaena sp. M125S2SP2A07QC]MCA6534738.1 response regulator [Pseudanabaena sp. M176S2SP2A07QC]MCA6540988.1 response regulator [Pseudanabaena sp. M037S2SP2A07QC]MCA6545191.1 response regulator [Pseudanabae
MIAMTGSLPNSDLVSNNLTDGQVVRNATLHILLAAMRVMSRSTGVIRVETKYHRWKLLLTGGGLVLAEEEGQVMPTLVRKYNSKGINFSRIPEWEQRQNNRPYCYPFVSNVYKKHPEITKEVLKEVILENLLSLHLEDGFSFVWKPAEELQINLPVWQLSVIENSIANEVRQWQKFDCVKHPYQLVQLIDAANLLARVGNDNFPLFAKVTTGQYRICAIADTFKQPIYRTALLLDKLAQKNIVSIVPLEERKSDSNIGVRQNVSAPKNVKDEPRVFIVDDSPVLLQQMQRLLISWGYQVDFTDDAEAATDRILEYKPTIVFIDINMPSLNGFDLIKQIRRQRELASLSLVLVTAENSMTNNFRARWANCRFLAKPRSSSDTPKFRDELRNLLRELAPLSTDTLV